MFKFIIAAVLAGSALASVPAAAEMVSVKVPYSDLNLANPAGQKQLNDRIRVAARSICGGSEGWDQPARQHEVAACMRNAKASAARQVELAIANARSDVVQLAAR